MKLHNILAALFLSAVIMILLTPAKTPPNVDIVAPQLSGDVEAYLANSESKYPDIRPGTEKTIIWLNPNTKAKTENAVIYLHGFAASRQETAPLCDRVAHKLGANLFYTRLTGHGRTSDAMAEASVSAWKRDALEALTIGRHIGDKVIVIGASTGGTLATWLACHDSLSAIRALVLLSPNFGPRQKSTLFLNWPKAEVFVPLLLGKNHSWTPHNAQQAMYWTTTYPNAALFPMMDLVNDVTNLNVETLHTPTLFIYSIDDSVVDIAKTKSMYERFPTAIRSVIEVQQCGDPSNHIVAGDILSPNNTEILTTAIVTFLNSR